MKHTEEDLQQTCVRWFELQHHNIAMLLHHSPNGGKRSAREGARFKKMGTRAGFPDLFLYLPVGGFHGLAIEMKTDKGRQQPTQKAWQQQLEEHGYVYKLCRSFDSFREIIDEYLQAK